MPAEGLSFKCGGQDGGGSTVIMKFKRWPENAGGFNHAGIGKKCISGRESRQCKSPEAGVFQQLEEEGDRY